MPKRLWDQSGILMFACPLSYRLISTFSHPPMTYRTCTGKLVNECGCAQMSVSVCLPCGWGWSRVYTASPQRNWHKLQPPVTHKE